MRILCLALGLLASALPAWAAEIVEVRVGRHPEFTRVVFELDRAAGYRIVAMHPGRDAEEVGTARWSQHVRQLSRVALVLGAEGNGLSAETLALCDERHRIDMVPGFDSLTVATAAAIALHHLFVARSG